MTSQNLCKSYLLEREQGIHVWGVDAMWLSLYSAASLNPDTLGAYTATGEVSGAGYSAGGVLLALTPGYPKLSPSGARLVLIDFVDLLLSGASGFTPRQGLIYNKSKANRAVAVVDFANTLPVTTSFGVVWPAPDDNNCIIRLGA